MTVSLTLLFAWLSALFLFFFLLMMLLCEILGGDWRFVAGVSGEEEERKEGRRG